MRLPSEWQNAIAQWAELNGNIKEVWLFGSRADDKAIPVKDDVDLAIVLMPPAGLPWHAFPMIGRRELPKVWDRLAE